MHSGSKLLLAVLAHVALCDFTAALVLNTQRVYAIPPHNANKHWLQSLGLRFKTIVCYEL